MGIKKSQKTGHKNLFLVVINFKLHLARFFWWKSFRTNKSINFYQFFKLRKEPKYI
jgi:hypothetical protein